jgi:hypothetical protein
MGTASVAYVRRSIGLLFFAEIQGRPVSFTLCAPVLFAYRLRLRLSAGMSLPNTGCVATT